MMRKLLYLFLLFSTAIVANAQPSGEGNEEIQSEYRQKIGIDYSMPDFSTSSLDESVIGTRLAKMLKALEKNKSNYIFYNYLGLIQAEQIDGLDYCSVKSYKIENVSKHGDVINIKVKTKLNPNAKKIKTADLIISFKQGISESQAVNDLFSNLTDYINDFPIILHFYTSTDTQQVMKREPIFPQHFHNNFICWEARGNKAPEMAFKTL